MKTPFLILSILLLTKFAHSQTYFDVERDFPCAACPPYTQRLSELPVYTEEQITSAFNSIAHNSGLEFGYPQGGCQQRAQMMHQLLDKQLHLTHARVWIFAPQDLYPNDTRLLEIADPNGIVTGGKIKWAYHVAPCLLRKNSNGSVDTVVIDPALNPNRPMLLKEWLAAMNNGNVSKYTFLRSEWYFFKIVGENGPRFNLLTGEFYKYEPSTTENTAYDKAAMERELAVNDVAMYLLKRLHEGYPDTDGAIHNLVGNLDNLLVLFADQERGYNFINNLEMRPLLQNHADLMQLAMNYYTERVAYWMRQSKLYPSY